MCMLKRNIAKCQHKWKILRSIVFKVRRKGQGQSLLLLHIQYNTILYWRSWLAQFVKMVVGKKREGNNLEGWNEENNTVHMMISAGNNYKKNKINYIPTNHWKT